MISRAESLGSTILDGNHCVSAEYGVSTSRCRAFKLTAQTMCYSLCAQEKWGLNNPYYPLTSYWVTRGTPLGLTVQGGTRTPHGHLLCLSESQHKHHSSTWGSFPPVFEVGAWDASLQRKGVNHTADMMHALLFNFAVKVIWWLQRAAWTQLNKHLSHPRSKSWELEGDLDIPAMR